MATLVLSAVGGAIGSSIGGSVLGLSAAVIGRAAGAAVGRVIDQRLLGEGSRSVETGKVDRFRLSNSGEGQPIAQVYGGMRVGGQVIWTTDFLESTETTTQSTGGKGAPQPKQTTTTVAHSYSINMAVALCEGEITRVGRVWADGEEVPLGSLNMRVYKGTGDQLPDPLIEAVEGAGQVPAYRGTAYVVFEDLQLEQFGNRVPQFSFEVSRPEQPGATPHLDLARAVQGVAMMPATGEYALATEPVYYSGGPGEKWPANLNTPASVTDFNVSLTALNDELPNCNAASLIVSWFSGDLRCQHAQIKPKVERRAYDSIDMPWHVAGIDRSAADEIAQVNGQPVYGGTPTDASVIQSIHALKTSGKAVMFYPFILMDQLQGNGLPSPYGGTQAHLPWRGRITLNTAPGLAGSSDRTSAADAEVQAFFGTARAEHFQVVDGQVTYAGPQEWTFSRFILHYAALCAAAGGVESFCIGSEMRGMTWIRGAGDSFPFVTRLKQLAADVRTLVGAGTKISYAADWSEYFGYQPPENGADLYYHLDPLWSDPNIDFIGIDNYMPLSDWRSGEDHADAAAGSIYNLDYLRDNIEGGEGYDWFYASDADRNLQARTPIDDGAHAEPWVYRYKDIRNWWLNPHHDRRGGVRQFSATAWQPQSKPIWFTEYGCAAIDKGTNQPNKFLDPKSSENSLPRFSNGARDDFIQMQYIRAMNSYYAEGQNNPQSSVYGGSMIDMSRAFVWAWDARPYPYFPNNIGLWNDGGNYPKGHWINGRTSARPLASVVEEICRKAGIVYIDTSKLYGHVRGYVVGDVTSGRSALQPLMLRYGFDAVERDGVLHFVMRQGQTPLVLDPDFLAYADDLDGIIEADRDPELDMSGRVRLQFVQADADFGAIAEEAVLPDEATHSVSVSEIPLAMTRGEGRQTVERWLSEARVSRDKLRFAVPPSGFGVGAGDVITLPDAQKAEQIRYRVDRVEQGPHQIVEAVRMEPSVYSPSDVTEDAVPVRSFAPVSPVTPLFLDLPLIRGDEVPHAPYIAATGTSWPGSAAVYASGTPSNYRLNTVLSSQISAGITQSDLRWAPPAIWDRAGSLRVRMMSGALEGAEEAAVLAGQNIAVIGDGSPGNWEVLQFSGATLVGPDTYEITNRLRGQQGTDGIMPGVWPAGSWFVLLSAAARQLDLGANQRGVTQHFRIGPAQVGYDHPSYIAQSHAFSGVGLRPYAPAHLDATESATGELTARWIRRTRVDGDLWEGEVPLGEERSLYRVQVWQADTILRETITEDTHWNYTEAMRSADGISGAIELRVAQISERFGPGPDARLSVNL